MCRKANSTGQDPLSYKQWKLNLNSLKGKGEFIGLCNEEVGG